VDFPVSEAAADEARDLRREFVPGACSSAICAWSVINSQGVLERALTDVWWHDVEEGYILGFGSFRHDNINLDVESMFLFGWIHIGQGLSHMPNNVRVCGLSFHVQNKICILDFTESPAGVLVKGGQPRCLILCQQEVSIPKCILH
jgi:hypothetical protein